MSATRARLEQGFPALNRAYNQVFRPGRMSVGLVVPLERYPGSPVPSMEQHLERVRLAEELGFAAVWLRDVPFHVPSFGDAGQLYDPFVYLGFLAGQTQRIALGVASIILPLRHPAHVAKAAASADALSGGRLLLGIASGDRPDEYPALAETYEDRGARFRDSYDYIRGVGEAFPAMRNPYGNLSGDIDLLPKPSAGRLPLLITGGSQQSPDWIARHGDGWMVYPQHATAQATMIEEWRQRLKDQGQGDKPVMQPLYVDLDENPHAAARPIHLGLRLGAHNLVRHLKSLERAGLNHVALNLRFDHSPTASTLGQLAEQVLPQFPS